MKITEPILKREQFSYQKQYENAIASSELLAEKYTLEELNELLGKRPEK